MSNLSEINLSEELIFQNNSNYVLENISFAFNFSENNSNEIIENNFCNYSFEIITNKEIFIDKVKYKFKTNSSNFTIEYWISNFGREILKEKKNTTSLGEKSFSSDFSEILIIEATLYTQNNCTINTSKLVYLYSDKKKENLTQVKFAEKNLNETSYIKILNEAEIKNFSTNILEYEIYRGNNTKRTVYFYHNDKKINSFEVEKYSKVSGKIAFDKILENNSLSILGFDIEKEVNFYPSEFNLSNNYTNTSDFKFKDYFEFVNFSLNNDSSVLFDINSSFDYDSICYIYFDKTVISDILNVSNISNENKTEIFTLNLDNLKISEKIKKNQMNSDLDEIELKLYCKYKKNSLKTYNSISYLFNFSLKENILDENVIILDEDINKQELNFNSNVKNLEYNYNSSNFINFNTFSNFENKERNFDKIKIGMEKLDLDSTEKIEVYRSKNIFMKENSYFGIFLAGTFILISFILVW